MIEDVYEPLSQYRDVFRAKFLENVRAEFGELVRKSGIDVGAAKRQSAQVEKLDATLASVRIKATGFGCLSALCLLTAVVCGVIAYLAVSDGTRLSAGVVAGLAGGLVLTCVFGGICRKFARKGKKLSTRVEHEREIAWSLMEPLNALYDWDIAPRLIERTVPRLQFDPYFSARRLADLSRLYGWDGSYTESRSVCFAQSGVINGNPFVFGDCLEMNWGTKTYVGTKTISWTETETDSDGKRRRVTKSETLRAEVEAPYPEYARRAFLVYGNDAAPKLAFTREPSPLSGEKRGFFKGLRYRHELGRLKSFSQNLEDESQYTLMGNHEFETLFKTTDRTDEVEYRILFTPVAQLQMLQLLKDEKVGYGDDFRFVKDRKINMIFARHLSETPIDTDPRRFRNWHYDWAERDFVDFNVAYFKSVYFALAPLLAIPVYQQTRTHEDIWAGVVRPGEPASCWEHEAIANYHGEAHFAHAESVTRNILKAEPVRAEDGVSRVCVTARGFRGVEHVTTKRLRGGDGRWHDVDVRWTEYLPVEKRTLMDVREHPERDAAFETAFRASRSAVIRRHIRSFIHTEPKEKES